uniref:Phage tail collar domain-containing protein n=1 Tax=viral metagenome TaxID=1070528 RepID=A0A6C0I425_9ZZZZ
MRKGVNDVDVWLLTNGIDAYNKADGNIGIGLQKPVTRLDVSGSINASSQIMVNYVPIASPIGTMSTDPSGWLICDGRNISRATYAALFSIIGTTFGAGNWTTIFSIQIIKVHF